MAYLDAAAGAKRESSAGAVGSADVLNASITRTDLSAAAGSQSVLSAPVTIATTSTTDAYVTVPEAGSLSSIDFSSIDALAAHDSNYITWTVVNLGQAGAGTTAMVAVSDLNTTKATGGVALTALAKRSMTLHGTAANLVVAAGDKIRIRATATGTLAGTVTGSIYLCRFSGTT